MRRMIISCLVLAGCDGGGGGDPSVLELDTFAPSVVSAGNTIPVTCLGVDAGGGHYVLPEEQDVVLRAAPADAVERGSNGLVARTAGIVIIQCGVDAEHLDPTAATVEIRPGQAASVTTTVDAASITAGEDVTATCAVVDAYDNPVTDATPTVRVAPRATGNSTTDAITTFSRAGTYTVGCHLDGVPGDGASVTVAPALPAAMYAAITPVEATFAVDAPVVFTPRAYDRYGNEVFDATWLVTASIQTGTGPIVESGPGNFQFGSDGLYRVTATVTSPTDGSVVLVAGEDVAVSGNGPAIRCVDPPHAGSIVADPGTAVTFAGATDVADLASLTIDGANVAVAGDGTFSAAVTTHFGINTVHVVATDSVGNTVDRTCAFAASPGSASEHDVLPRTASLGLLQGALYNVVTDAGAAAPFFLGLTETLGPANPLVPPAAPRLGSPLFTSIEFTGTDFLFPYFNAAPMDGAVGVDVQSDSFVLRMQVRGEQDGTPIDLPATIDFGGFDLRVVLDLAVDATGRLRALPRLDSVVISFSDLQVAVAGDDPDLLAVVQRLADGLAQTLVVEGIRNWLTGDLAGAADAIVGDLDVTGTEAVHTVDRVDSGTIALGYATAADPPLLDSTHGVFRIGTSVTTAARHARATQAPLIAPPAAIDPPYTGGNAVAAVHAGMFGQVLHALWRAGFYDATADESFLETSGASITTSMALPPAVSVTFGPLVLVDLGAIDARVDLPGVFDDLAVSMSARVGVVVEPVAGDLAVDGVAIGEVVYATGAVSLDSTSQQALELLLRRWATGMLEATFDHGFAAAPTPSLAGRGVTQPTLEVMAPHLLLHGTFAAQE